MSAEEEKVENEFAKPLHKNTIFLTLLIGKKRLFTNKKKKQQEGQFLLRDQTFFLRLPYLT